MSSQQRSDDTTADQETVLACPKNTPVHVEDELLQREYELAQQLKNVCDDSGREVDPSESTKIIHELGLIYRQRSPDKFSLIKSAGLLNAAIIRKPSNISEITQDLADLCKHILQQAEAANQTADLIEKAKEVKSSFTQLRNEVDQFLSNSKSTKNKISTKSALNEITTKLEEDKISNIQFIQTKITDTYMKTMANLCEYCENVMGKPPCQYTVMGMGSLAREEATPYSDFEHMITLEEANCRPQHLDYFRWFTLIFHIVILNVQETIIPALHIPSLNDKDSKLGDWFFDSHTRGISLDGMMPHASKYPLGRGPTKNKPWAVELIQPFNNMLKYLSSESDLKEGYHLSDLLTKTCFVYGSREIYDQFVEGIITHLHTKTHQETREEITTLVKDDLNKFSIRLCIAKLRNNDTINIKQMVYRSSTLFIGAMGRFHNISQNSCFDIVKKMAEQNNITPQTKHSLLFAVAIACEMRLRVYMGHKSQRDLIEIKADKGGIKNFLNVAGQSNTIRYFQVVYCLQCEVAKLLRLTKLHFYTDPQLINIATCYAFGVNAEYESETSRTMWNIDDFSFDDCLNQLGEHLKNMRKCVEDDKTNNHTGTFEILADHLYKSKVYDEGLEFYKHLLEFYQQQQTTEVESGETSAAESSHSSSSKSVPARRPQDSFQTPKEKQSSTNNHKNIARTFTNIGKCLGNISKPADALKYHQSSLKIYQKISLNEETDPDVASTLNNIGNCLYNLHEYTEGLEYLQRSLKIYQRISLNEETDADVAKTLNNIGLCLKSLNQYSEGLEYYHRSLRIYQKISLNEETDHVGARTLNNIGLCLRSMHQYAEGLEYLKRSLKIKQKISLNDETERDVALTLNNIGLCFNDLHQYTEGLDCYQRSLKIYQKISLIEETDPYIAVTLNNIGLCLNNLHQYTEGLEYLKRSLKIKQKISLNEETDPYIAVTLNNIGLCLNDLHQYTEGLEYLKKSLKIYQKISLNEETDPYIAVTLNNIGLCLNDLHQYTEGLEYLKKSLKIKQKISLIEETDRDIAVTLNNIGLCLNDLHQYTEGLEYLQKSLKIYQKISLNEETDRDVASTLNNIASCFKSLHQYSEGLDYSQRSLRIYQRISLNEETDPDVASTLNNIGSCLKSLLKYTEGLEYLQRSLRIYQKISLNEETDPDIARTLNNIGLCLNDLHQYTEGLDNLQRSLKIYQKISLNEETDSDVALTLHNMGCCYYDLSQYIEALGYFQKSYLIYQNAGANSSVAEELQCIDLCELQLQHRPDS